MLVLQVPYTGICEVSSSVMSKITKTIKPERTTELVPDSRSESLENAVLTKIKKSNGLNWRNATRLGTDLLEALKVGVCPSRLP